MWTDRGDGTLTPGRGSAIHLHVVLVMLMTGHDITVNFWWARPKMRAPAHSAPPEGRNPTHKHRNSRLNGADQRRHAAIYGPGRLARRAPLKLTNQWHRPRRR